MRPRQRDATRALGTQVASISRPFNDVTIPDEWHARGCNAIPVPAPAGGRYHILRVAVAVTQNSGVDCRLRFERSAYLG